MKRAPSALSGGGAAGNNNSSNGRKRKGASSSSSSAGAAAGPAHQGGILRFLSKGKGQPQQQQPQQPPPPPPKPAVPGILKSSNGSGASSGSLNKKAKTITGVAAARRASSSSRTASAPTVRFAPAATLVSQQEAVDEGVQASVAEVVDVEDDGNDDDPILARLLEASAQRIEPLPPLPQPPVEREEGKEGTPGVAMEVEKEGAAAAPPAPVAAEAKGDAGGQEAYVDADAWRAEDADGDTAAAAAGAAAATAAGAEQEEGPAPQHQPPQAQAGGNGSGNDIRRFLPVVPPPPRRRCPALPLPAAPKSYPANRYWHQAIVARPWDRPGDRAATRAAVAHLLVQRMRPFSLPVPPMTAPAPVEGEQQQREQQVGLGGAVTLSAAMTGATVADPPSDMAFDPLGALLAVGTTHGAIRVYDFDEVLSAARGGLCATTRAAAVLGGGGGGMGTVEVHPLQVLDARKAVSAVRWNPRRDSEVAVAFWHWAEVYVYDLETWSSAPTRIHRVGHRVKGAAGGNYSLAFVSASGVTTLAAGSAYGVLRGWGMAAPDAVAWEVRTRGNGAITALCPAGGGSRGLLVGATASPEAIYVWDVANLQTPILGATPAPPLLHTIDVHGLVRGLGCPSPSAGTVLVTTETGLLLQLDPRSGRVLSRQLVGRHDLAATAQLPGGIDAVITHDASSATTAASTDSASAAAALNAAAAAAGGEWPTAVYTPEGTAVAAAFPPRRNGAVVYRETGDVEAEANDSADAAEIGEGKGKGGMSAAAFDVTLPGVLLRAEAGKTTLRASDGALHRFLCPHPEEGEGAGGGMARAGGGGRRTSFLSIEGRVYTVRDLWPVYPEEDEEGDQGVDGGGSEDETRRARLRRLLQRRQGRRAVGTEIELMEPFHRDVEEAEAEPLEGGVRMQAALRPVFEPEGAAAGGGGGRQWAHVLGTLKPGGAVGCLAVNPLTHHVVLGYAASGMYEVLGCERYRQGWENEEEVAEVAAEKERHGGAAVVVVE